MYGTISTSCKILRTQADRHIHVHIDRHIHETLISVCYQEVDFQKKWMDDLCFHALLNSISKSYQDDEKGCMQCNPVYN